jgi:hypothetical protein
VYPTGLAVEWLLTFFLPNKGVELDELLWNSIERNIFANAIELTFNLGTYVSDKIKVKLTR